MPPYYTRNIIRERKYARMYDTFLHATIIAGEFLIILTAFAVIFIGLIIFA
jgi:hypothetical protein